MSSQYNHRPHDNISHFHSPLNIHILTLRTHNLNKSTIHNRTIPSHYQYSYNKTKYSHYNNRPHYKISQNYPLVNTPTPKLRTHTITTVHTTQSHNSIPWQYPNTNTRYSHFKHRRLYTISQFHSPVSTLTLTLSTHTITTAHYTQSHNS